MKRFKWDKKYLNWGVTAFCVIACAILFYMLLHYVGELNDAIGKLFGILSPFIWGLVISYLLAPLLDFYQRTMFTPLLRKCGVKKTDEEGEPRGARGLSVTLAEITLLVVIGALIYLILPQVYNSIEAIVVNSPTYIDKGVNWAEKQLENYPQVEEFVVKTVGNVGDALSTWIQNKVLPSLDNILQNLTNSLIYILKSIYNVVIGIIVSVYILHSKENFRARCVKILYSVFSIETSARIRKAVNFTDKVFIGFINGKLLDSAIIGVMCYIFCVIAGMPYALLVSVIVGVTNIIPFFGPFIGAVPSALLVLMDSPAKCLIFIIFIFLLQQFDGNILGPKILGNTTGISGFWVMFAIILGAGLFGFWGMLLGVPVWVVLYTGMKHNVNNRLEKRNLTSDTEEYLYLDYIDPDTGERIMKENKDEKKKEPRKNETPDDNGGKGST